jgi:hypothetical protein
MSNEAIKKLARRELMAVMQFRIKMRIADMQGGHPVSVQYRNDVTREMARQFRRVEKMFGFDEGEFKLPEMETE